MMLSLKNKVVMVTGGAGFVGSHLVDALADEQPERIVVIDDLSLGAHRNLEHAFAQYPQLNLVCDYIDATEYKRVRDIMIGDRIDVVFDLAVQPLPASLEHPRESFSNNINITSTMCELLREGYYDTLVHFSSSEVYGTSQRVSMCEDHPLNPTTPYAASKVASDMLIRSYREAFGVDCAILRPFNIFGPRQNVGSYAAIIPVTIKRLLDGERPVIFGDGHQTRDFTYVADVVRAAIGVYKHPSTRGFVVNVGSGQEVTANAVVATILDSMRMDVPVLYQDARPGDVRRHIANTYLAEDLIDYKITVPFSDGIRRTVDWYIKQRGDEK